MIYFYDGTEFAEEIEKLTGLECFYKKRNQSKSDHFVIDDIDEKGIFADNRSHKRLTSVQLTLFTKSPYRCRKYNDVINENFNTYAKYTFETEYEWYQTIFEFQVIYGS